MNDPHIRHAIACNLQRLLAERKMSERQLAASVGVSHMTINRLVNEERSIKAETLFRIADFFGIPSDALRASEKKVRIRA